MEQEIKTKKINLSNFKDVCKKANIFNRGHLFVEEYEYLKEVI